MGQPQTGIRYHLARPDISDLECRYVEQAVRSGWPSSLGPFLPRFEELLARMCAARHAVAVSSGTAGLHLALETLGIGPGDEVVVPALSFVAVAASVLHAGATPVFADSEPETWCLDPAAVERAITKRTRAILVVHLYGHPADMDAIGAIARSAGCAVVEDAAEAHGASCRGKPVGNLGDIGVFSFYGNKLVTTGEGGALVLDDDDRAERARFLKDHAMDPQRRYWHSEVGFNYRMTNMQAALGCAQLERFEAIRAPKAQVISAYRQSLCDLPVELNPKAVWAEPAPWLACLLVPRGRKAGELARLLREQGIDTRPFFTPLNRLPPYREYASFGRSGQGQTPVAGDLAERGLNLPSIPTQSDTDLYRAVRDTVGTFLER